MNLYDFTGRMVDSVNYVLGSIKKDNKLSRRIRNFIGNDLRSICKQHMGVLDLDNYQNIVYSDIFADYISGVLYRNDIMSDGFDRKATRNKITEDIHKIDRFVEIPSFFQVHHTGHTPDKYPVEFEVAGKTYNSNIEYVVTKFYIFVVLRYCIAAYHNAVTQK